MQHVFSNFLGNVSLDVFIFSELLENVNNPDYQSFLSHHSCHFVVFCLFCSLEEATFVNIPDMTDRVLFTLVGMCPKLVSLTMRDCFKISDPGLQMVYESLPHLKNLTVAQMNPAKAATPQPTSEEALRVKPAQKYAITEKTISVLKVPKQSQALFLSSIEGVLDWQSILFLASDTYNSGVTGK